MSTAAKRGADTDLYTVEIRQNTDPHEAAAQIGGLRVQSIKFVVEEEAVDGWYKAAVTGMGAVANGTDWPAGTYLVVIECRNSSTAYVSRLGEHREFNLNTATAADWAF